MVTEKSPALLPAKPTRGHGDGAFEPSRLVLDDFGHAQGWTGRKHLRFPAGITGDGRVDIVGFGGPGVHVARNTYRRFSTRQPSNDPHSRTSTTRYRRAGAGDPAPSCGPARLQP
ncbi:hypothetical protein ACWDE9_12285 [Streptomyces olivaceoviridis]